MSNSSQKSEPSIRELPIQEMVALHERVMAALPECAETIELDLAFREELKRHLDSIDSGSAGSIDTFRALKKI